MRRVWTSRGLLLPLLLLAASFVFIGRNAEASSFNPTLTTSLTSSAPAPATSDINQVADWGTSPTTPTRSFPASSVYFTPGNWGMNCVPDPAFPSGPPSNCPWAIGAKTGNFSSTTTFGLLNSQCAIAIPVTFPNGMRNASTNPADSIPPGTGFANLSADVDDGTGTYPSGISNGIPDGAERWNTLLGGLIAAGLLPPTPPRERQILNTVALGTNVWVDVLTYDPGLLGGAVTTPLGYASTFILENANPLNPPSPSLITDTCGLSNSITQSGLVDNSEYPGQCADDVDNDGDGFVNDGCPQVGDTPESGADCSNSTDDDLGDAGEDHSANGGIGWVNDGCPAQGPRPAHRTNPGPGTDLFFLNAGSQRDADQGPSAPSEPTTYVHPLSGSGFVNSLDTCPFQPNLGSPMMPVGGGPLTGDDSESPGDGIDEACDPNPSAFDGSDFDGDSYLNRGDNCPLVANGVTGGPNNQSDVSEVAGPAAANEVGQQPVDGGPASDSIGDSCDLNPTVPDGHFHSALKAAPVCIIGGPFSDGDGDGWCDATEFAIGGSTAGTPEALSVPGSCSDGADNDADGNADLNDSAGGTAAPTGCQLPTHNLLVKNLVGSTAPPCTANTKMYQLKLNSSPPITGNESGQISIYLDSQPSYVPPVGPNSAPGKSAGSVQAGSVTGATVTQSGPINIDGDADVEWLMKATVTVAPGAGGTTVKFKVAWPAVPGQCGVTGNTDFTITGDLCHANDVAPLGVGPLNGACAGSATSDGGQDRNSADDIKSLPIDTN